MQGTAGADIAALERKKAQLYAKSKEYQKELEKVKVCVVTLVWIRFYCRLQATMPSERPPMTITELVEFKDRLKKREQDLKLKRAKVQAYQGLSPVRHLYLRYFMADDFVGYSERRPCTAGVTKSKG